MKDFFIILAIILNVSALVAIGVVVADEGCPDQLYGWLLISASGLCPIVNLIVIFSLKWAPKKDSWLGLYLKRKRLEEQRRIDALEKDKKGGMD